MAQKQLTDWALSDIPDIGNGDPNKQTISATLKTDGWGAVTPDLQDMNQILHLLSHYSRKNNEFILRASGYEAEAGEMVVADNSAGVPTIDLPASPLNGQWVVITGATLYSTNLVIVDGNGNDIMILADQSINLNINNSIFLFYWDNANSMWKINLYGATGRVQI